MVQEMSVPSKWITSGQFFKRQQVSFPNTPIELVEVLNTIIGASKIISKDINRAGLIDIIGESVEQNQHGDKQQKLDILTNTCFINAFKNSDEVCAIVSEEERDIIHTGNDNGKYVIALDPLDGSSNIDVNVPIGTIFSVYRRITPEGTRAEIGDFMQGGRKQVAAGYILYGSSTILVYTSGHGVNSFTFEQSFGEYFLSTLDIKIPKISLFYSINEIYFSQYSEIIQKYILDCRKQQYAARYIGSLVADFHRNMLKGGIYMYPATPSLPNGKLRLLYEAYPLAFLAEQCDGMATDGYSNILDLVPQNIHQRTPLFIGTSLQVKKIIEIHVS
jgi:fructose-1,6-bisphosphatase I